MKPVGSEIVGQVRYQVANQIINQVAIRVWNQVRDQVIPVRDQVEEEIRARARGALYEFSSETNL